MLDNINRVTTASTDSIVMVAEATTFGATIIRDLAEAGAILSADHKSEVRFDCAYRARKAALKRARKLKALEAEEAKAELT